MRRGGRRPPRDARRHRSASLDRGGCTGRTGSRSRGLREPVEPIRGEPRGRGVSLDAWVHAAQQQLGADAHPAEVAALLYQRIERLPAPRTRELLLRSALLRVVREAGAEPGDDRRDNREDGN